MNAPAATPLGTFPVDSGRLTVTDPGCDPTAALEHGAALVARNGTWAAAFDEGRRFLLATHESIPDPPTDAWVRLTDSVTVDSGQAGVFDAERYEGHGGREGDNAFYGAVCVLTLDSEQHGGVLPEGTVAAALYGEGVYPLDVIMEGEAVIAVRIDFDPVDDEWDDDDDEWED